MIQNATQLEDLKNFSDNAFASRENNWIRLLQTQEVEKIERLGLDWQVLAQPNQYRYLRAVQNITLLDDMYPLSDRISLLSWIDETRLFNATEREDVRKLCIEYLNF